MVNGNVEFNYVITDLTSTIILDSSISPCSSVFASPILTLLLSACILKIVMSIWTIDLM